MLPKKKKNLLFLSFHIGCLLAVAAAVVRYKMAVEHRGGVGE